MFEDTMTDEVKNLLIEDLLKDNFTYSNHRFSLRYRYRRKRILKNFSNNSRQKDLNITETQPVSIRIPLKYILLIVILLVQAVLGFTIYRNLSGFVVREQNSFSLMFANFDQNAPEVLTEKYYLDMDLSDYEQEIIADDEITRWVVYKLNGKLQFDVIQTVNSGGTTARLNTENAMIMPTNITVCDWDGMYYQSNDGCHNFFFYLGDYIISYSGFLDKKEMEELVKATKFA